MIQSFANQETEELFYSEKSHRFAAISRVALRKLLQMNQARALRDLAVPPGNQLKPLKGDRSGWHSIRINDQWRIVFRWTAQVAIVDCH